MTAIGLLLAAALITGEIKINPRDGLKYVWVGPGAYMMGCSSGDSLCYSWEPPAHRVTIAHGFWIGQTEVTQAAYLKVTGSNPSLYKDPKSPVDRVGWNDAQRYCSAAGMRLPNEREWEYAARGGNETPIYGPLDSVAWYDGNSDDRTHNVGLKQPNGYGLYDTLGNVWEWVEDKWEAEPAMRILRGGSFYNPAREIRVSDRLWATPETAHRDMGVRCAGDQLPQ